MGTVKAPAYTASANNSVPMMSVNTSASSRATIPFSRITILALASPRFPSAFSLFLSSLKSPHKMTELLNNPRVPAIAKVRILEIILERTYGKPETAIKLNSDAQSAEAARARLEAIAARIRIEVD